MIQQSGGISWLSKNTNNVLRRKTTTTEKPSSPSARGLDVMRLVCRCPNCSTFCHRCCADASFTQAARDRQRLEVTIFNAMEVYDGHASFLPLPAPAQEKDTWSCKVCGTMCYMCPAEVGSEQDRRDEMRFEFLTQRLGRRGCLWRR
jgi:hypothetical protein